MSVNEPLITVGMPVYNGQQHLREAIGSIRHQSFTSWELLVVDDCSTDGSLEVIKSIDDPRVRLLTSERNQGLVNARNRIMDESRGSYLAWLDQDDVAYAHRLSTQRTYMEKNPHVAVCGGWSNIRVEAPDASSRLYRKRLPLSREDVRSQMLFSNPLLCNTVIMNLGLLRENGLRFREPFGNALDYDMWSQASDGLTVLNIRAVLGEYRVHGGQTSQGSALDKMNIAALEVQQSLFIRCLGISPSTDELKLHQLMTVNPQQIDNEELLRLVMDWLARLREASMQSQTFEPSAFDRALARQWLNAIRGAFKNGLSASRLARATLKAANRPSFRRTTLAHQFGAGIVQAIERSDLGSRLVSRPPRPEDDSLR